jgi:uncharacterized protein YjiS (DUF1127 family)
MEFKMEMHTHASLRVIHGLDGGTPAPFSLVTWLSGVLTHLQEAQRRQRDYEILLAKTERELTDIGLTRADVVAAVKHGAKLTRETVRDERC